MEVACERSYCNFKIPFKKIHITGRIQVSSPFLTICNEINILAPYVLFDFVCLLYGHKEFAIF